MLLLRIEPTATEANTYPYCLTIVFVEVKYSMTKLMENKYIMLILLCEFALRVLLYSNAYLLIFCPSLQCSIANSSCTDIARSYHSTTVREKYLGLPFRKACTKGDTPNTFLRRLA